MSMSTIHAPNGHEQQTVSGPRKPDRDAELVERLRRQEPGAPEALVATYGDRVYRLAIRITGNEQDAEEVVQDALWTAARKIDTFKGESAFGSWIYRITANAAYQKLREPAGPAQRGRPGTDGARLRRDRASTPSRSRRLVGPRSRSRRSSPSCASLLPAAIDELPGETTGPRSCSTTWRGSRTPRSRRRSTSACPP